MAPPLRRRSMVATSALAAFALISLGTVNAPAGAVGPGPDVVPGEGTRTPKSVSKLSVDSKQRDLVKAARDYLASNKSLYGIADVNTQLTVLGTSGIDGTSTVRFQQKRHGVPVLGAHYLVHLAADRSGTEVVSTNGKYFTDLTVGTTAKATAEQATTQAERLVAEQLSNGKISVGAKPPKVTSSNEGLVILPEGKGVLTYQVRVTTSDPTTHEPVIKNVFVDANTAWPIRAIDAIQTADPVKGTGVTSAGATVPLDLTLGDDGRYQFVDQSKPSNARLKTYDASKYHYVQVMGYMPPELQPFSGPTSHFAGAASESGLVDAHANAGHVYDYYRSLGRDSLDGKGGDILSLVGVTNGGFPYVNAFWDGSKMVYGSGDEEYRPLSAELDVVAHEMTHGVVEHTAGLIYLHQSGAVNEAVADYFGNAVDVNIAKTPMTDKDAGLLGEDLCRTKSPRDCALRDLNDGRTVKDYIGVTSEYDAGGVHLNSTIFSGALWDIREALGGVKADRLIYKALTEYMTPTDDFVDAAEAVLAAARDTHVGQFGMGAVKAAFTKRGIKQGWETRAGDAQVLVDEITTSRTGPAASGGYWVLAKSDPTGTDPYSIWSGRTNGSGTPVKLSDPIDGRFNVLPATDGKWAVWFAWGAVDAKVMRAPIDGSGEPEVLAGTAAPSNLSVDGDWVTWTTNERGQTKQWFVDARNPGVATPVDRTYHKASGSGQVKDGKLYYVLVSPYADRTHINIAVRDLENGPEEPTLLPEFMAEGSDDVPAGIYGPKLTEDHIVVGVDQKRGERAGIWRLRHDGTGATSLVAEGSAAAPILGAYDATDEAVTFENWPGTNPPRVMQIPLFGGKVRPMSCATGMQYRVSADLGTRAVWLDGSYGSTSLVTRERPRNHC